MPRPPRVGARFVARVPRLIPLPRPAQAPPHDPPFDDEPGPADGPPVDGALALRDPAETTEPAEPAADPPPDLRRLAQAITDVLAGRRPIETLAGRLSRRAYGKLGNAKMITGAKRIPMAGLPRIDRPAPHVIEACVVISTGDRSHALALRLERHGIQWLCTDLDTATC